MVEEDGLVGLGVPADDGGVLKEEGRKERKEEGRVKRESFFDDDDDVDRMVRSPIALSAPAKLFGGTQTARVGVEDAHGGARVVRERKKGLRCFWRRGEMSNGVFVRSSHLELCRDGVESPRDQHRRR